jgi:hypothetical protein
MCPFATSTYPSMMSYCLLAWLECEGIKHRTNAPSYNLQHTSLYANLQNIIVAPSWVKRFVPLLKEYHDVPMSVPRFLQKTHGSRSMTLAL